ncbi:MAG: hypothetical protein D6769_00115 [Methanobacteriota archaeon]|nr:MAG: hypothetical protein D6769_00115 [Euryarchaeota archaeon]
MRALWKGVLSVGISSIPLKLYRVAKNNLRFRLMCREHKELVHYKKMCGKGEELSNDEIVRGAIVNHDNIAVEEEVLETLKSTAPKKIVIDRFIEGKPPIPYVKKSFVVMPDNSQEELSALFYSMHKSNVSGVGVIVYRGREELCSIYSHNNSAYLSLLHFEEEMEKSWEWSAIDGEEASIMEKLIAAKKVGSFGNYIKMKKDDFTLRVMRYIEAKRKKND